MKIFGISFNSVTAVLLLSAPVLLTLYYYLGINGFDQFFQDYKSEQGDLYSRYWQFLVFSFLVGILPLIYIVWGIKQPLSDYGLSWEDWKTGLKLVLILIPLVIVPLMWIAAQMPDIKGEYPMARVLFQQPHLFWQYEFMYIVFYYMAWEFFFRGFLLFGLVKEFGPATAIMIQTISSCLIHLGKPVGETLGSIPVGILFGILAWRTKSIWYGWALHIAIGVLTDYFVLHQAGVL